VGAELLFSTPKTARSRRTVPLPPSVVALLKKHRKTQAAERLRAGDQWQVSDLVFTTALGRPVDGRRILAAVKAAAKTAGLDGVKVHTLRHSAAVAWLENGTHIRAAADLLGHSSVQVTGDVYAHSSDQVNRAAVDALGAVLDL